jgi:hypothetical protein
MERMVPQEHTIMVPRVKMVPVMCHRYLDAVNDLGIKWTGSSL